MLYSLCGHLANNAVFPLSLCSDTKTVLGRCRNNMANFCTGCKMDNTGMEISHRLMNNIGALLEPKLR